jgi:uncharacterized damage-inducible protein DinB
VIDTAFVATMARYNAWQNRSLIAAASGLDEAARRAERGAYFGSIHGTFNHLLWADEMWLSRFIGSPRPGCGIKDSSRLVEDWAELVIRRGATDATITDWAGSLVQDWLDGELTWFSGATQHEMRRPTALLVVHLFNHQTHHRGQVHAMLTAAGARPDDTDLMLLGEPAFEVTQT